MEKVMRIIIIIKKSLRCWKIKIRHAYSKACKAIRHRLSQQITKKLEKIHPLKADWVNFKQWFHSLSFLANIYSVIFFKFFKIWHCIKCKYNVNKSLKYNSFFLPFMIFWMEKSHLKKESKYCYTSQIKKEIQFTQQKTKAQFNSLTYGSVNDFTDNWKVTDP